MGKAEEIQDHPGFEAVARFGFVLNGLVHFIIGWTAIQLSRGGGGESADQSGAFQEMASAPGGEILLWIGAIGGGALALWYLVEAALMTRMKPEWADVAKCVGKAVAYGALGWTASVFARGGSSSSSQDSREATSSLMQNTAGRGLLIVVGLALVAAGGYHIYKGVTKKFHEDLRTTGGGSIGKGVDMLGLFGYPAKGVALAVMGGLFVIGAIRADSSETTGFDGALRALRDGPFGTVVLLVVGLGFIAFGIYSIVRARFAKM